MLGFLLRLVPLRIQAQLCQPSVDQSAFFLTQLSTQSIVSQVAEH